MNERIFPTFPGNNIECNFTHLANNSTFSNKKPHPLKVTPILLNLKQVIPPLTFFCPKVHKIPNGVSPLWRKIWDISMIPTKTKMWTKFFFWLECWCVSQNNKRHFFDNQRKKYIEKKNFFVIFAPLLLQVSCTQVPKNTTLPFEIIFSSDFF